MAWNWTWGIREVLRDAQLSHRPARWANSASPPARSWPPPMSLHVVLRGRGAETREPPPTSSYSGARACGHLPWSCKTCGQHAAVDPNQVGRPCRFCVMNTPKSAAPVVDDTRDPSAGTARKLDPKACRSGRGAIFDDRPSRPPPPMDASAEDHYERATRLTGPMTKRPLGARSPEVVAGQGALSARPPATHGGRRIFSYMLRRPPRAFVNNRQDWRTSEKGPTPRIRLQRRGGNPLGCSFFAEACRRRIAGGLRRSYADKTRFGRDAARDHEHGGRNRATAHPELL